MYFLLIECCASIFFSSVAITAMSRFSYVIHAVYWCFYFVCVFTAKFTSKKHLSQKVKLAEWQVVLNFCL